MPRPIIHDGTEQREMTDFEHAEWLALVQEIEANTAALEAVAAAKVSARAKLLALGLTDEEIAALLGA